MLRLPTVIFLLDLCLCSVPSQMKVTFKTVIRWATLLCLMGFLSHAYAWKCRKPQLTCLWPRFPECTKQQTLQCWYLSWWNVPFTVIIHPINEFVVYLCMFQGNKTCNINKECCLHCLTLELLDDCVGLTVLVSLRPLVSTEIWLCIHTVLCCTLEELARRLCLQKPSGSIRAEYFLKVHHTPVCKPLHEWLRCQHEEIWRVFLIFSQPQMPVVDGNHWISQDMILERFSNISMQSYDDKTENITENSAEKGFLSKQMLLAYKKYQICYLFSANLFSI